MASANSPKFRLHVLPEHSQRNVTLDGYAVPRVSVQEIPATGQWNVIFDGRFCVLAEDFEEVNRWLPLLANVQAVGEGYSCHGANSVYRPNPHQVRVACIGLVEGGPTGTLSD